MKFKLNNPFFLFVFLSTLSLISAPPVAAQHHGSGHGGGAVQMEEVVVSADRIQDYIDNHPQQVSVMTRALMKEGGYTDLNQALNAMPGVEVKKSGSGIGSRISIRGSGSSGSILVLINGRPASNSQFGSVDLASIPLDMVQRVEVFKPPVPVWIGPGGSAGAVNIVLAEAKATAKGKKKKNSRIGLTGGSFGAVGANASHLTAIGDHKLRLTAAANHKDGYRDNSDRDNGSAGFQWNLPECDWGRWDIGGRYFQSEHGSAGPLYNLTPDARQSYKKGSLDIRLKGLAGETGDFDLKAYMDAVRLEDQSQSGFVSTLDAVTFGVKNETSWWGEDNAWALRLSGNLAQDSIDHTLTGDHNRELASLGLQGDRTLGAVTVTGGLRCDYTSDFNFQPAASGGIGFGIDDRSSIKLNAGYEVNVPTFGQLYQSSHGSIDQVRGNPDLKEESVLNVSLSANRRFAKGRVVEITLFREETDDLITYVDNEDGIKQPVNVESAWRCGVESVVDWKLTSRAGVKFSYIWQQSNNDANDNDLVHVPEHKFKATLRWAFATKTRTETTITSVSRQYSDIENTPEEVIDAYTTVDFRIIQPVRIQGLDWEFFAHFVNLLNEDYQVHYGYPDDGFRFTLGASVEF